MHKLLIASTLLVSSLAFGDSPVEVAKVYLGVEGARAAVLLLKPTSDNKCLLKFSSTGWEFDGKVLPCTVEDTGRGPRYHTTIHGRGWVPAIATGTGTGVLTLYVGPRKELTVKYDEKASRDLKVDDVYKEYKSQEASGALAAIAKFDRAGEQANADKAFKESLDAMNKACGSKITAKIAWPSVKDDIFQTYSVSSYCGNPLNAMAQLCRYKVAREVIPAKISTVNCTWGDETKFEVSPQKTFDVTLNEKSSNVEENATEYLKKAL